MTDAPFFSIIIPVYNGGEPFRQCLAAIPQSLFTDWELIVVDDGSTDDSARLAARFGATVFNTQGRQGPAAARNLGARAARGAYLYFIDADCRLHPNTLSRIAHYFQRDPDLEALFGSYDDAPAATTVVAQYKNLFHHYVHQTSRASAATFWTGCGAIKRSVFLRLGGFDVQRYRRPSVEDIDLGYRLKRAGGRIRLAKDVQVKHLKAWTLTSLLKTDIFDRGIPWTQLMLRNRVFLGDLNLQTHNRVSVVVLYGLLLAAGAGVVREQALLVALMLAVLLVGLNARLYLFFYQKGGAFFLVKVIPLHWLYYFYNALSFVVGLGLYWQAGLKTEAVPPPKPFVDGIEPE
jgi:glycosyltransferase involved in cell wall biosynthesis